MNKPTPFKQFSEFQTEHSLAHELPYWDFFDDAVALSDGTLSTGLNLEGIAIETWDSERVNQFTLQLRSFLNSLPDGLEVAFSYETRPNFRDVFREHRDLGSQNHKVGWLTESRLAALSHLAEQNYLLCRKLSLFIYRRIKTAGTRVPSFFSAPSKFKEIHRAVHEQALQELLQVRQSIAASLESVGVTCKVITREDAWRAAYQFLNPVRQRENIPPRYSAESCDQTFTPEELRQIPELSLPSPREQLVFSDAVITYDSFYLDGLYHRAISLKALPEFTHSALVSRLSLPFPHTLHLHIKIPEQSKELSLLHAKRRMAHSLSMSHGGRAADLESEAKLTSTEELLRELIQTGQKIFYFQFTLLLRASTKEEIERQTKTALSRIRDLNSAEAMAETVANFKVFKSLLPLGSVAAVRPKRIKTENLADFLPVYQPYEGTSRAVCLFQNRAQGLTRYDPFEPSLPNYNALVTGSSGAGKSFLNNLILLQYIAENPLVFIIDIGGSYRKLCEFLDGQYVELSPPDRIGAATAMNPFSLSEGETKPSPRKIKFLLALLEIILTDNEGDRLNKLDKSLLEEAIVRTYELPHLGGTPTLSDFAAELAKSDSESLREFSRMLYPWTGNRPYGQLLDTQCSLDIKKPFVVFDLKGLSAYPDLQSAVMLIMTDFILSRIDVAKEQKKRIIMDECWELLKHPASRQVMEYCVRTLRKSGSGITFITQGLEEIVSSPIGPAILSNTATKFILMQRGDLDPTRKVLKLNDEEMSLIASLKQSKGHYSESFLVANDARTVIRAVPTPAEYWLATSDAADNQKIESERDRSPEKSLCEVLQDLATRYPFGAKGEPR